MYIIFQHTLLYLYYFLTIIKKNDYCIYTNYSTTIMTHNAQPINHSDLFNAIEKSLSSAIFVDQDTDIMKFLEEYEMKLEAQSAKDN